MRTFTQDYLNNHLSITPRILALIGQIREFKGKQTLYSERKPEVLENLRQVAFIESVESSNRLEHIETDRSSLQLLLLDGDAPENRPQTELAGYRDVLNMIHKDHRGMRFTASLVRQLHRDMLKYTVTPGGDYKSGPNDIVEKDDAGNIIRVRMKTVAPHLVEQHMNDLHTGYTQALNDEYDSLLLIPNYVHDFLAIHPFSDGNGRMARLLTVLLLHQNGFDVARYISIEKLIEDSKDNYYESLELSDRGWSAGEHNQTYFTEYMLGVILAAYRKLESDVENIQTGKGYKSNMVKQAIESSPDQFTVAGIKERCPSVSRDTIRNVLRQLVDDGAVKSLGRGRSAKWAKIGKIL